MCKGPSQAANADSSPPPKKKWEPSHDCLLNALHSNRERLCDHIHNWIIKIRLTSMSVQQKNNIKLKLSLRKICTL